MTTKPKGRRVKVGERLCEGDMFAIKSKPVRWHKTCEAGLILTAHYNGIVGPYIRPTNPRTPRRTGRKGRGK